MQAWGLVAVAIVVLAFAAVSGRLVSTPITAAMFFVGGGLLIGTAGLDLLDVGRTSDKLELLAEATLAVVLFADAFRIDLYRLRQEYTVPLRLLGVGLPLTIVAGVLVGVPLLGLDWTTALILAVALAPTDAALGQAVVTDERLPSRIRQGLNVESGLNDGICVPLLYIAIALTQTEAEIKGATDALALVAAQIGFGLVGGVASALAVAFVLARLAPRGSVAPGWLRVVPLAGAVLAYTTAAALGGSGFIAAFAGGMLAGGLTRRTLRENVDDARQEETLGLLEEVGGVLDGLTFIVFGAAILGAGLGEFGKDELVFGLLCLTLVRMLPVALAMLGTGARLPTVAFLGWFGPRGLASIVFGVIILDEAEIPEVALILNTIAATVGLSVVLHGLSAVPLVGRYLRWFEAHPKETPMEQVPAREIRVRRHAAWFRS